MKSYTVHCQRPGCKGTTEVRFLCLWRRQRFCSRSCGRKVSLKTHPLSAKELGARGGKASAVKRREGMVDRIRGLSPVKAYRKGRMEGWHAGYTAAVKRIERERAA